jgi:hypothetical protein
VFTFLIYFADSIQLWDCVVSACPMFISLYFFQLIYICVLQLMCVFKKQFKGVFTLPPSDPRAVLIREMIVQEDGSCKMPGMTVAVGSAYE